ncbi:hypothetical protein EDD70_1536 [Hydrogenoanaerobacterium saccharovorans]|uniref:Acetylglutamate kinase n=1 Tax=Hydrogenoanaerobacterium saccharovorans TaxID=474960 RepID=A0A1H7ZAI5_9FIRM|nr:acetylglutamate kinase [Hydrogenoanaerobacterium saccharovorans]RPF48713.1 hypothetical protein EDD70_1536 [Hydrogenoanaerobacterium saccharovorans]SEM55562.1 hypothetical protein SAMN05216180_0554 [Hydrogenoanaerobacterium saccharovorans]
MYNSNYANENICYTYNQIQLINEFRKLWEQHIMWTRSFIISLVNDLGDLDPVTTRLLRNPTDFANSLRPFYGNEKAAKFEQLLKDHLLIASQLVTAAKKGDTQAVDSLRKKWYENADQIAMFLAQINPYWNQQTWQMMLYEHLKLVENEAVTRISGQYNENVSLFDSMEKQALAMADQMSYGIINQFYIQ